MASDHSPLLSRTVPYTYVINPCSQGAVDYECTSDYPIHAGTACLTQKPFSENYVKR